MSEIDTAGLLMRYFVLLFSLSIHECAHALAADHCGDDTPRFMGRITLNPIAHIDPIGTVLLPLFMMFSGVPFLFGWAKPVMVNPRNFRNYRRDDILVSIAGVATNLMVALLVAFVIRFMLTLGQPAGSIVIQTFLMPLMAINLVLAVFNLMPIPPLDGSHVVEHFMSPSALETYRRMRVFSFIILIVLINTCVGQLLFGIPYGIFLLIAGLAQF